MLDIHRDDGPGPKIYFSHCTLPSYIDPQNVSTKKKPFSTFNAQPFSHTLDLILPEELYSLIQTKLLEHGKTTYAKVHMSLADILDPDFFNPYIKQGNITMLSSPRPALPSLCLHSGTLTLTLDLPTYQRCGLPGVPIEYGGAKHQKSTYRVVYDLRSPSMTHGKKGFKRLEWAAKNVLSENFTWLFYNANVSSPEALREGKEPLSKHHPTICEVEPEVERVGRLLVPGVTPGDVPRLSEGEAPLELLEYMGLVGLGSQRLQVGDKVDPYVSRYEVPDFNGRVKVVEREMVRVRWRGFLMAEFAREMFLLVKRWGLRVEKSGEKNGGRAEEVKGVDGEDVVGEKEERWVGWQAQAFGGRKAWSVLQWAGRETLVWECEE